MSIDYSQMITAEDKAEQARQATVATIAARRWEVETAGIIWRGHGVATDRESQSKLKAERDAVNDGLRVDGKGWKCLDLSTNQAVFRPTTNVEMMELTAAAYRYVSDCFEREGVLLDALRSGTLTETMLEEGWPDGSVPAPAAG